MQVRFAWSGHHYTHARRDSSFNIELSELSREGPFYFFCAIYQMHALERQIAWELGCPTGAFDASMILQLCCTALRECFKMYVHTYIISSSGVVAAL